MRYSQSSVVVVGENLDPSKVNPDGLFGAGPDTAARFVMGPFAHYTYNNGQCRFEATPERIDLGMRHDTREAIPDLLSRAAWTVAGAMDATRGAEIQIEGIGLNFHVMYATEDLGRTGLDFCSGFVDLAAVCERILGVNDAAPLLKMHYQLGEVSYSVRVEPEIKDLKDLFLAVTAHIDIGESDSVTTALSHVTGFKEHVEEIYARVF